MSHTPTTNVTRAWRCLAEPERRACDLFAVPTLVPPQFISATLVDTVFLVYSDWTPEKRRIAFQEIYNVTRVNIGTEEEPIEGYFTNQTWMTDLYACQQSGHCSVSEPLCLQLAFYNSPA